MTNGEFERTVYTGGYSAATRTYYFNTYEDPAIRSVSMDDCDTEGTEHGVYSDYGLAATAVKPFSFIISMEAWMGWWPQRQQV